MEMFFLLTEVILVGFGLLALTMLTNLWYATLAGSLIGIVAMERVMAAHSEGKLHERIRAAAKKTLPPGGRS